MIAAVRAAVLTCLLLWPAASSAQEAVIAVQGRGSPERVARWTERVRDAVGEPVELEARVLAASPAGTVAPERLEVLTAIESLLMRSRAARAQLQEADALRALAQAESLVERALDVPGIAAWYAEVQLAIAVTAAQAGQRGLSEAALRRAASVDPSRVVQAAEARPDVVALARQVRRSRATAPRGRFEVRSDAPGAQVAVDDEALGSLPRRVELPVGPHLVRVDAPGHGSWASIVQVREGDRPALEVALSPLPPLERAHRAERAAAAGDAGALRRSLAGWDAAPRVRMVWAGEGERDRALAQACEAEGCGAVQRLDAADWPVPLAGVDTTDGDLAGALQWLGEPLGPGSIPDVPLHERWELWVGLVGALLIGAGIAIGVGVDYAQQEPRPQLEVYLEL